MKFNPAKVCHLLATTACLLGLSTVDAAPPQTVYRCGPDGRVYSQTPCIDGRPVTTEDSRSASQQKSAKDVAARDAQQAQQLAEERKQREASVKGQAAAGIKNPTTAAAETASAPPRKPKVKAKAAEAESNMSPAMRLPAQATISK